MTKSSRLGPKWEVDLNTIRATTARLPELSQAIRATYEAGGDLVIAGSNRSELRLPAAHCNPHVVANVLNCAGLGDHRALRSLLDHSATFEVKLMTDGTVRFEASGPV